MRIYLCCWGPNGVCSPLRLQMQPLARILRGATAASASRSRTSPLGDVLNALGCRSLTVGASTVGLNRGFARPLAMRRANRKERDSASHGTATEHLPQAYRKGAGRGLGRSPRPHCNVCESSNEHSNFWSLCEPSESNQSNLQPKPTIPDRNRLSNFCSRVQPHKFVSTEESKAAAARFGPTKATRIRRNHVNKSAAQR